MHPSKRRIKLLRAFSFGIVALVVPMLMAAGCGYHVVGTTNILPATVKTIAVPAFKNHTTKYRVEQRLTEAVAHEFLSRTSYKIVSEPDSADAVLHGDVTSLEVVPAVYDATTERATAMLITVRMKVSLVDKQTNKELYKNDNFEFHQQYAISESISNFFDESSPALDRMSRDFASSLVSGILTRF
jgi:outer membrane lipopolysaccharide assembly protein LptE/RlpB